MPSSASPSREERLTLSQLASYDDVLTDALVDRVYFWTVIRKNRSKYFPTRGIKEEDVPDILLHNVIVNKNSQKAEELLLKLPGLRKYVERLNTSREKEDFKRHMRKYVNIWLPDCPFEVSTTNRYTILTQEAAVTARKYIRQGDLIKYLSGNLVPMTADEEKDLDLTRRDFSIVMSSRKKTPSLFLGPARFANHDCNANAKLVTRGPEGMGVVALRSIDIGEEVTVTYGADYFGERNCECLCKTCEEGERNGWGPRNQDLTVSGTSTPALEAVEEKGPYSFRRRRKYALTVDSLASSMTAESMEIPALKKARYDSPELDVMASTTLSGPETNHTREPNTECRGLLQSQNSTLISDAVSYYDESDSQTNQTMSVITQTHPEEADPNRTLTASDPIEASVCTLRQTDSTVLAATLLPELSTTTEALSGELLVTDLDNANGNHSASQNPGSKPLDLPSSQDTFGADRRPMSVATDSSSPPFSGIGESQPSVQSTDASSVADDSIYTHKPSAASVPDFSGVQSTIVVGEVPVPEKIELERRVNWTESELSDLSDGAELDDKSMTITRRGHQLKRRTRKPKVIPSIEPQIPEVRYQGDYLRTPLLLGESYSRWVDCKTCDSCWVQPNGYYTRKECPRCERHSKLYGYRWPKTDKEGRGDEEERVMDHRTVHRFVRPEEEARIKKRGKGLQRSGIEMPPPSDSSRSGSEAIDFAKPRPKVGRPRKPRFSS